MSIRSRRCVALPALASALAAGLVACSSSDGPPEALNVTPPAITAVPTLESARQLRFPTEAYVPTAAEQNLIAEATTKVLADCMNQFGFTWTGRPNPLPEKRQADRAYGVADLATAQRYGYRLPPSEGRVSAGGGKDGGASTGYSPSELLVLTGSSTGEGAGATDAPRSYGGKPIPSGGCAAEARRRATGIDDLDPTHLAESIGVAMFNKSKSDPRVVQVIEKWSACMKESGYNYPSPLGVRDPKWSSSGPVSQAEVQTAVTDVKCKQRTNLIGIWFSVESGYEKQAIQQNIEQLTQIKKRWADATRKAAQLLGRPAPHQS